MSNNFLLNSMKIVVFIAITLTSVSLKAAQNANTAKADKQPEKVDIVVQGKTLFEEKGCAECHSSKQGDTSFKTGPNLFGLFQVPAKAHPVKLTSGEIIKVEADNFYFDKSLDTPEEELAIQSSGTEKGKAYLPIMPKIDIGWHERIALLAYLKTLNTPDKSGPKHVWKEVNNQASKKKASPYNNELWVGSEATFARGHIADVSTRTIHVGLPNKVHYSFDTQNFSIKKVWSNTFLDVSKERINRGVGLNSLAKNAIDWQVNALLIPLTSELTPVDLSFKNWPTFSDPWKALEQYRLAREKDDYATPYLDSVAKAKGRFIGIDHSNKVRPSMQFMIENMQFQQAVDIKSSGEITYVFTVNNSDEQVAFLLNSQHNQVVSISHGEINQDVWSVPKAAHSQFSITLKPNNLPKNLTFEQVEHAYTHDIQPVVIAQDNKAMLPPGYRAESFMAPKDRFGRDQLFEPLALDFANDGTAVVGSRTAGIWKIHDKQWHFFAEGFQDLLGLHVEDNDASNIVVAHKPELTRVIDTNKDGYADIYQTINDDWRFAGNYCEYVHGPVADGKGNYYLNLNLAHGGDKVNGVAMGTFGGYDGWLVRINKDGSFEPWSSGLRSPAGLGNGPNNMLLYTDNQGSFVGTSKLHVVEKNDYFGYPASLKDDERYRQKEISWPEVNKKAKLANIYFPHGIVANSPGNPTYDTTQGGFGPFAGQILVGDQTLSNISRVTLEEVNGKWQGAVMPFISQLKSGAMRLVFAPDNSLWVGQTGRGWYAKGGSYEALQRITWDGETMPFEIKDVNLTKDGFTLTMTDDLSAQKLTAEHFEISSWRYQNTDVYGSPRYDLSTSTVDKISQSKNSVSITLDKLTAGLIYEIKVKGITAKNGMKPTNNTAYYTLNYLKN